MSNTIYIYRNPSNPQEEKKLVEVPNTIGVFYGETVVNTLNLSAHISKEDTQHLGITSDMLVDSHYLVLDVCGKKDSKLVYAIRGKNEECVLENLQSILEELASGKKYIEKVSKGYTIMDYESGHIGEKIPVNILSKTDKEELMSARLSIQSSLKHLTKVIVDILEE